MVTTAVAKEIEPNLTVENVQFAALPLHEINAILEQRVAQRTKELAEANRFVQKITDAAPMIIYVYDLVEQRNIYASREAGAILGYTPEQLREIENNLFPLLMHPDDINRYPSHFANVRSAQEGEYLEFEYRMRHADGTWRVLISRDTVFQRDPEGQVVQILGIAEDVTERRAAEALARKSDEKFRALVENGSDIILLIDREGTILYSSPSVKRILGHEGSAIIGLKLFSFVHPDDLAQLTPCFESMIQSNSGHICTICFRFRCANPCFRHVEGIGKNLLDKSDVQAIVINLRDVTERVATEEHLQILAEELRQSNDELKRRNEELQRSNRELEDFASIASHDLQEPLRKIQTLGDLLQRKAKDTLTPECQDYVERMLSAARRMQSLVRDVLSISRLTTSTNAVTLVDMNQIVYGVLIDLEQRIFNTGGFVQVLSRLPNLMADGAQMRQLMQNLIGNALKYHHPERPPEITIFGEEYETDDDKCRWVRLVVSDNGIGFDPQYANRIFQMFERLEGRSDHPEGTGVGLAICRKIAERHHGTITAESKPGEGAVFTILLPQDQPAERRQIPDRRIAQRRANNP